MSYPSAVHQLAQYDLFHPVADVVHSSDPGKLIVRFQLFRDALGGCILLDQQRKHLLSLLVNFSQIAGQLAGCQKICVGDTSVLAQPVRVPPDCS